MRRAPAPSQSESGVSLNPFSVSYVQPGSIPYFFEPSFIDQIKASSPMLYVHAFAEAFSLKTPLSTWIGCRFLGERFVEADHQGQIIGPHGSGKSTITESFAKFLNLTGTHVIKHVIHDHTRRLSRSLSEEIRNIEDFQTAESRKTKRNVVIFDGYEQLSYCSRVRLRKLCRQKNCGLLITTHKPQSFVGPILFRTDTSDATVEKLVSYLLDDSRIFPGDSLLRSLRRKHNSNIRAILDSLYDWWNDTENDLR
jgi:hypothetical protein